MTAATRPSECTANGALDPLGPLGERLLVAIELANRTWTLVSTRGLGAPVRHKTIPAANLEALRNELARARVKFDLVATAPVRSCYEAGRDGFGPHRLLGALGVDNVVLDAASIEVPRRRRRAKTDRLDGVGLLRLLLRDDAGDHDALHVVRVPSVETEARRQLHRDLETVQRDRQRVRHRMISLVVTQGARLRLDRRWPARLDALETPDGRPLPSAVLERLRGDGAILEVLDARIAQLEAERHRQIRAAVDGDRAVERVRQLLCLRGLGETSAWVLSMEYFWRDFRNRRQVASAAGFTPTPFASGDSRREQGISKAGNARIRRLMVQLAWAWLRWQPESTLTAWFGARFNVNARSRRVGIVAVARRLLIQLWRYVEFGELPPGAVLRGELRR